MAATVAMFDSLHSGPLHCVEFDFFASRLATASSDRTIRLWRVHPQGNATEQQQQHQQQLSTGALLPLSRLLNGAGEGAYELSGGLAGGPFTTPGATLLQELHAHDGPVWQVRWAHPSFGNILASCGYDKRIVVWQQQAHGSDYGVGPLGGYGRSQEPGATCTDAVHSFVPVYSNEDHAASVNALAFAPPEWGLMLAAGSSDGCISILMHSGEGGAKGGNLGTNVTTPAGGVPAVTGWTRHAVFSAHFNGVYAVVWAPPCPLLLQGGETEEHVESWNSADGLTGRRSPAPMLASGGADCQVRIWGFDQQSNSWTQLQQLKGSSPHTDWVRDVAFQPASAAALVLPSALLLASCSEDSTVKLWVCESPSQKGIAAGTNRLTATNSRKPLWRLLQTLLLPAPVWRIAWSASGTLLAAACGDEDVMLFRESVSGVWERIKKLSGPPPLQQILGAEPSEDNQQQQPSYQRQTMHGMQEQGMQLPGVPHPGAQHSAPQQSGVSGQHCREVVQQPAVGQQVGLPGIQGLPSLQQQVQEAQQQLPSIQTLPQQPLQTLNTAVRYPRPQAPSQQLQQQVPPPISLVSSSQRPPLSQVPPLSKQEQMPEPEGTTTYEGTSFPGGPHLLPAGAASGVRLQQQQAPPQQQMLLQPPVPPSQQLPPRQVPPQQVEQTLPWKVTSHTTTAARVPSVMPQQTGTGIGGVSPAPLSFTTFAGPLPPPAPPLLSGAGLRQQPFTQQPSAAQQHPLQQPPIPPQTRQQDQGSAGTTAGTGGPPFPPPFLSTPPSQVPGATPVVSPPAETMQQPRPDVAVNPFQAFTQGSLLRPPLQQQPGMTGGQLPPPPSTAAGLTPPLSMQQHAFASGGARQQQPLYTPYKST